MRKTKLNRLAVPKTKRFAIVASSLCAVAIASTGVAYAATAITEEWIQGTDGVTYIGTEVDPITVADPSGSLRYLVKYAAGSWYYENMYDYKVDYTNNLNAGTAGYSVTTRGNNLEGSLAGEFEISKGDLSNASVSWAEGVNDQYVQTGEAITPELQISIGSKMVSSWQEEPVYLPDTDYDIVYRDEGGQVIESPTAPGVYTAEGVAEGNNVEGTSPSATFTILEEGISLEGATVGSIGDQVCTGSEIEPDVNVTMPDGTVLVKDKDYVVSYQNNVNVGTATVTIEGTGAYVGTLTTTFDIAKRDIGSISEYSFSLVDSGQYNTYPYSGKEVTPKIEVSYGGYELVEGKDYELEYSNNVEVWKASNLGREEGEVFDDDNPPTVTARGIGNFEGTKALTFSIMPSVDLSNATIDQLPSLTFNGTAQPLHVDDAGRKYINLLPQYNMCAYGLADGTGTLYEESYRDAEGNEVNAEDIVNAGSYTLVITAIEGGGFTGSKEIAFSIAQANFSDVAVEDIADQEKVSTAVEPKPVMTLGDYQLREGVDYTVSYSNNTADSGYGRATIAPMGNFNGDPVVKTFRYDAVELAEVSSAWLQQGSDTPSMVGNMVESVRIGDADSDGDRGVYLYFSSSAASMMNDVSYDGESGTQVSDGVWKLSIPQDELGERVSVSFTYTVAAMGRTMTHAADMVLSSEESQKVTEAIAKLPASPAASNEAAVKAARDAYESLSDFDKLFVPETSLEVLEKAEASVKEAIANRTNQNNGQGNKSSQSQNSKQAKAVTSLTVNTKTVTAKSLKKALARAGASAKNITSITLGSKVKKVKSKALKSFKKLKTVNVETKKLTKKSVKGAFKGSKVKTVKVKIGSKKTNKKYVKKYKKVMTKKNVGKKVRVK